MRHEQTVILSGLTELCDFAAEVVCEKFFTNRRRLKKHIREHKGIGIHKPTIDGTEVDLHQLSGFLHNKPRSLVGALLEEAGIAVPLDSKFNVLLYCNFSTEMYVLWERKEEE